MIEKQWDPTCEDFNISILCCHTFNQRCLIGWSGNEMSALRSSGDNTGGEDIADTCPLCRYYQNP